MSVTSHVPKRLRSVGVPALAAVVFTTGVVAAAGLAGATAMLNNDHTGNPVTYASGESSTSAVTASDATSQVMNALASESQLVGLTSTSTRSGLQLVVALAHNDDRVADVWLADLAVGAVAERSHSGHAVANDIIATATAVGPSTGGDSHTTDLGVGAVRLGQLFGSPADSLLSAQVANVAKRHGLTVGDLQVLHPLESALRVTFVVPDGAKIDWTIDQLRTELVGEWPDVEGVFLELDDSHGEPLLQSAVAYRTGEGGLWFAPGQDARFGAVHGGTPGN